MEIDHTFGPDSPEADLIIALLNSAHRLLITARNVERKMLAERQTPEQISAVCKALPRLRAVSDSVLKHSPSGSPEDLELLRAAIRDVQSEVETLGLGGPPSKLNEQLAGVAEEIKSIQLDIMRGRATTKSDWANDD